MARDYIDFGSYLSVVCYFDDDDEEATRYAYRCESEAPTRWDTPLRDSDQLAGARTNEVCSSCLAAAEEEGVPDRETQVQVMIEIGGELPEGAPLRGHPILTWWASQKGGIRSHCLALVRGLGGRAPPLSGSGGPCSLREAALRINAKARRNRDGASTVSTCFISTWRLGWLDAILRDVTRAVC